MNFRITYLHIYVIHKKGKKRKERREKKKNSDNMVKKMVNTYR